MNKPALIFACLVLPVAAWAADGHAAAKPGGKRARPVATASAPAASAVDSRVAVRASKTRGLDMSVCRKQAEDKGLRDVEAKQFMVACMRAK